MEHSPLRAKPAPTDRGGLPSYLSFAHAQSDRHREGSRLGLRSPGNVVLMADRRGGSEVPTGATILSACLSV